MEFIVLAVIVVVGILVYVVAHNKGLHAKIDNLFHHVTATAGPQVVVVPQAVLAPAAPVPVATPQAAPAVVAPPTASGGTAAIVGDPVSATDKTHFIITDAVNGLVRFPACLDVPHWGEYSFAYEGAKFAFAESSQAWQTINWNCGQEEFAEANPQTDLLSQRAVTPMVLTAKPGTTELYWVAKGPALPKTLSLPNHLRDNPDLAIAYIRALPNPKTVAGVGGFGR